MPEASSAHASLATARAARALALACTRYWTGVASVVKVELRHWAARAEAIGDPELRALALEKLRDEGFTAQAAAMLATLAPKAQRTTVAKAIVALEVMYDYLDGLSERPASGPLSDGESAFASFTQIFDPDESRDPDRRMEAGYVGELAEAVSSALARLPSSRAIAEVAHAAARRSAQAQTRMHAAPSLGAAQLEQWATREARGTALDWREMLAASASSVLALHALIAAAGEPRTTSADAVTLDSTYLSIAALSTMLDSLIDDQLDTSTGAGKFIDHYATPELLADALVRAARRAKAQASGLPNDSGHLTMLAGIVAYFASDSAGDSPLVRPAVARVQAELRPIGAPALVLMRAWRGARLVRHRLPGRATIATRGRARGRA